MITIYKTDSEGKLKDYLGDELYARQRSANHIFLPVGERACFLAFNWCDLKDTGRREERISIYCGERELVYVGDSEVCTRILEEIAEAEPFGALAKFFSEMTAGDVDGALEAARLAIPAGLAKGSPKAAAAIYRQHLDRLDALGLDRPALSLLADQLLRDGDVAAAAWTFSQALDAEPGDAKAFKGLLRVAEHHLEQAKAPLEAVRVYRYLLERAPGSPLADHARVLLADAERKAAREP